jgi:hypothetical protein
MDGSEFEQFVEHALSIYSLRPKILYAFGEDFVSGHTVWCLSHCLGPALTRNYQELAQLPCQSLADVRARKFSTIARAKDACSDFGESVDRSCASLLCIMQRRRGTCFNFHTLSNSLFVWLMAGRVVEQENNYVYSLRNLSEHTIDLFIACLVIFYLY